MAAVAPDALALLRAGSVAELSDMMRLLMEAARLRVARSVFGPPRTIPEYFHFSDRLRRAFSEAEPRNHRVGNRLARARTPANHWSFRADHVPQLFWQTAYRKRFAKFFSARRTDGARRFCSLALVKLATGATWATAAAELKMDDPRIPRSASHYAARLMAYRNQERFLTQLVVFADWYDDQALQDFGQARRRLEALTEVPFEDWRSICSSVQAVPGRRGDRNRFAAVWLWTQLTGGDHHFAPGFSSHGRFPDMYNRFVRVDLPLVRSALLTYGRDLVEDKLGADPAS
jgi:hypothetical protein